jgi:DNA-binding LytR/AlgR family response regulator
MLLNCMVVDDEPMSRNVVKLFIEKTDYLKLSHECTNAIDAANILRIEDVDIIFLDVEMPEMSGLELVKTLNNSFEVILITSAVDYAVEAFENSITDYIVKPIEYGRFIKAVNKARNNIQAFRKKQEHHKDIFVKSDSRFVKIKLADILYIEALADYVIIKTEESKFIVHSTMKGIEKRLPVSFFARVHRSYIVNVEKIDLLEDISIVIKDKAIPIGASYKEDFMKRLNFL